MFLEAEACHIGLFLFSVIVYIEVLLFAAFITLIVLKVVLFGVLVAGLEALFWLVLMLRVLLKLIWLCLWNFVGLLSCDC